MHTTTIARVRTHACPRCHGDLFLDAAEDDVAYYCLQCGRRAELAATAPESVAIAAKKQILNSTIQARAA